MQSEMKQLVYDLPTRIFHWLFAGLFIFAFVIAKTVDDESATFVFHMLSGIVLFYIVLLRIVWGFVGSRYARFSSFVLSPNELAGYLSGILKGDRRKWAGHNPASSWAAVLMFALALGLGITGYLMTGGGQKETFEDLHELLANSFVIVAIIHVAGIFLHTARHKELIGLSMVNGCKQDVGLNEVIPSSRPFAGAIFLVLVISFAMMIKKNYDPTTQSLKLFGSVISLGENEGGGDRHGTKENDEDDDD